ncbi:hypothetical protein ES703_118486 [subsurface metagenome]
MTRDDISLLETKALYLGGGDIDIIWARKIVSIGGTQETEAIGKDLQDPLPK